MINSWWYSFWHKLIYRSIRMGNYRKVINRFTGEHRVYRVHPLARAGLDFNQEQMDFLKELFKNERKIEAQELILAKIEDEMKFDGLAEKFVQFVFETDKEESLKEFDEWLNS